MIFNSDNTHSIAARFTVVFSVVAALILPVGYFVVSYKYLLGILETEAEINATLVSGVISSNPELWRYETVRIEELLARQPRSGSAETRRLFDEKNILVAENANALLPPQIKISHEVSDNGEVAGRIEINRSLLPILLQSGILAIFGMSFGLLLYRWLPFQAVVKAGEKLLDANDFLMKIMEGSSNSIVVLDPDNNIQMFNGRFQALTGYSREELLGRTFCGLFSGESRSHVDTELRKVSIEESKSVTFETALSSRHGLALSLICGAVPLLREGIFSGLIVSLDDITERKKTDEEKLALERQFQQTQKLESLGVLAGGIAHDFNNILAIISGYCFLTKDSPESATSYIPEIEKAVDRAAGLCRQMQAYAGKTDFIHTLVNVSALVDEMVTMLKATTTKNVDIQYDFSTDIPGIKGDDSQIRQIVMNLIINSSEAIGEEQGEIRVSLAKRAVIGEDTDKDHLGSVIPPGWYVCLEVTDTGCGMDDETKQRIFEPFYTTKFVGRGLGMSAVLGIIASHQGALQLSTHPGRGTTFKVYLPFHTDDSDGVESLQHAAPAPWQGSGTVLLVEDEELIIFVAKTMLKEMGFTVIGAANGREALQLYQMNAENITLVVTDVCMPVMNGYELILELKKLNPELPIIICSGYEDTVVTSRVAREDIAGLVSKPYHFEQFREVLKNVIEESLPEPS